MFATLIESRAEPQRRPGSSLASILIHGAIVTGAAIATARDAMPTRPAEPLRHVVFERPVEPPPPATRRIASASVLPTGPVFTQRFAIPTLIPTSIPVIDYSIAPTTPDFTAGPIGTAGITCEASCATGLSNDADRSVWTARDITMQLREQPTPPRYPETLRRAGIEGNVIVKFVVDTTGRIDMSAIEIVSSDHELFSASVREALAKMRFSPAMVGERKVKALAIMPFRFTLR